MEIPDVVPDKAHEPSLAVVVESERVLAKYTVTPGKPTPLSVTFPERDTLPAKAELRQRDENTVPQIKRSAMECLAISAPKGNL